MKHNPLKKIINENGVAIYINVASILAIQSAEKNGLFYIDKRVEGVEYTGITMMNNLVVVPMAVEDVIEDIYG